MTNTKWVNRIVVPALFLYFSLFYIYQQKITNFDYGKLVKYGEVIIQEGKVFNNNLFSYTYPDYPFINHHWGTGVIFYLIHQIAGLKGLTLGMYFLFAGTFLLFFMQAKKWSNIPITLFFTILVLPIIASRNQPRPEAFSFIFFALSAIILIRYIHKQLPFKYLWFLPLIQLLWINTHILFFLGWFLQGALFLQLFINKADFKTIRNFAFVLLAGILICFVNPAGLKGVLYPFMIMEDIQYGVSENSPFLEISQLRNSVVFIQFEIIFVLGILGLSIWWKNKREAIPYLYLAMWLIGFGLLAFWRIRAMAFFSYIFILFSSLTVSLVVGKNKKPYAGKWGYGAVIGIILLILFLRLPQYYPYNGGKKFGLGVEKELPKAAAFYKAHNIKGPIFNNFDIGDYLIYYLFPDEKIFVDSRPEAYPPGFFKNKLVASLYDEKKWLRVDYEYNFNVIFLGKHPQVYRFISKRLYDNGWYLVYNDKYNIIFIRNNNDNQYIIKDDLIRKKNNFIMKEILKEIQTDIP